MADAISADDVTRLLMLVAPGFFAWTAYGWVLPRPTPAELPMLVTSVALSLPLVVISRTLAEPVGLDAEATDLGYVALLLGLAVAAGYSFARIRCLDAVRKFMLKAGHRSDPAATVLMRSVMEMKDSKGQVVINFKDGKGPVAGTPRFATEDPQAPDPLLFLDHVKWWDSTDGKWGDRRRQGGVLVRLDEVRTIELNRDVS